MTDVRPRSPTTGAALLTVVTLESLRVFIPATVVVLPDGAGLTVGSVATIVVVVLVVAPPALAPLAAGWPRQAWISAGVLTLLARGALLLEPSGLAQLLVAGLGSIGGLTALTALAAGTRAARAARVGILVGLSAEALLRTTFATLGPLWSQTPIAALTTITLLAALVPSIGRGAEHLDAADTAGPSAWPWWWLLPALALTGAVTSAPGRIAVATGWTPGQIAAASSTAQVAAVLAAVVSPRIPAVTAAVIGGGLTLVGTTAALPASGWSGVLGPITAAIGLGVLAGIETGAATRSSSRRARALVAAGAMALGHGALLAYYLGPPLGFPWHHRVLLLLAAGTTVPLALAIIARARVVTTRPRLQPLGLARRIVLGIATIALVTTLVATASTSPIPPEDDGQLTVATYQLRSGFGTDGRYDPRRQAALLRDHDVDVVVANGVDRGWWLTGGQDLLPLFADELGLEHVRFVPAADEVHGHALLSRYPIAEFEYQPLPDLGGRPTQSLLAAVLVLGDDTPLGIVGTELISGYGAADLQLAQARAVAGTVARLRERNVPTILLGDLGAAAAAATTGSFEPLLSSALPEGANTFPSGAPDELRDHVLLSPDLRRSAIEIPSSMASSHLPVIVTVERLPPPG